MKRTWSGAERPGRGIVGALVWVCVLAGLIAAAIGGTILHERARRAILSEIGLRNRDAAITLAARLDQRLETAASALELVSTRGPVRNVGADLQTDVNVVARDLPLFERIVLYDLAGRAIAATSPRAVIAPATLPERRDLLDGLGARPLLDTFDPPSIEIVVPIEDPPGTRVGTIAAVLPIDEMLEEELVRTTDPTATQFVVDGAGRIVAHPDAGTAPRGPSGSPPPRPDVVPVGSGSDLRLRSSAPLSLVPLWATIEQPAHAVTRPADVAAAQLIAILALVVLATVVAVSVAGRWLFRDLGPLADAADRLGSGEHGVRAPARGYGEVRSLATAFNRMAEALERRFEQLREHRAAEDRLRREREIAATLERVGRVFTATLDTGAVIRAVTDTAVHLTSADTGAFLSGGDAYVVGGSGFPAPDEVVRTTLEGETVRIGDTATDPRFRSETDLLGSYLAVPVVARSGEVVGGLFFGHVAPAAFTEAHERIAAGIAAQASVALDNARLYDAERSARLAIEEASRRLALVSAASAVAASSLDLDRVLRRIASLLVPDVGDVCVVDLMNADGFRRYAAAGDQELAALIESNPPSIDDLSHPVVRAIGERQPVLYETLPDAFEELLPDGPYRDAIIRLRPTSAATVPLIGRTDVYGAISLSTSEVSGLLLDADDLRVIEEIARRTAMAIENARLFATQLGVAETLQRSLLVDRLPVIPGVLAAARYLPGGPDVEVGGDWYDIVELPDGKVGLAMGDVVGRGIQAAAVMGQIRNALRAYAFDGHDPCEVLGRLNRLQHQLGSGRLSTVLYGTLEPDSGVLRVASAGHPPLLLVPSQGPAGFVSEGRGVPLGVVADVRYEDAVVTLEPGSTIVLYTDGLIERRGENVDEGLERLRDASSATVDLEDLCDSLLDRCLEGQAADDDVALLVVRMAPLTNPLSISVPARPGAIAPLRAMLRRWLALHGVGEAETHEILVAAGEAITNAVVHGSRSADDDLELHAEIDGELVISVADRGRWRRKRASSGGRGLTIMEAFMDDVDISSGPRGTVVTLRRKRSG